MNAPNALTLERMRADPKFRDVTSDSQNKALQATIDIDRDKAALLGVEMADIRTVLYLLDSDPATESIVAALGGDDRD